MTSKNRLTKIPGNSPLKDFPSDYFPEGCGFWFELKDGLDAKKKMFFRNQ